MQNKLAINPWSSVWCKKYICLSVNEILRTQKTVSEMREYLDKIDETGLYGILDKKWEKIGVGLNKDLLYKMFWWENWAEFYFDPEKYTHFYFRIW